MDTRKNYITKNGLIQLKKEFDELFHEERPKMVETVAWAASLGDRSENADYIYGKRRLREIDSRLKFLSDRIEKAFVVEPHKVVSDKVVFGATVTLLNEENQQKVYQIVGEDEWDIKSHKISWKSPLAAALLGKKEGEDIRLEKPTGEEEYFVIKKIEFKG